MKITLVVPVTEGLSGGLRVAAIYADRLARRGHTVFLVGPPPKPMSVRNRVHAVMEGYGWLRPFPRASHFTNLACPLHTLDSYRPVTDADVPDADVVIATWWETAEWVAALAPAKGAKAYFLQGYEVWERMPVARVEATWRLPLQKITIARWMADLARDKFGDPNAIIVPNGVDAERFNAPVRGKQSRPTFGVVYSDLKTKGCEVAFAATEQVRRDVPDLRLLCFGTEERTDILPVPEWVEFEERPKQARIPEIYAGADAWLFPSREEGFGLPILEAMGCRTPVIGAHAGAAPELLRDAGGFLVRTGDQDDMARMIRRFVEMGEEEWRGHSARARAVAESHTWDTSAALLERALEQTAERARMGPGRDGVRGARAG